MSYSVLDYSKMIADPLRMKAYTKALESVITEDSVVLDLGAGTGVFSVLAATLGARRVFAIESNNAALLVKPLAASNGVSDKIEVFHESSDKVTLPELADVIISDLRGLLPLFGRHIPTIKHAREHFLKPQGVLMPSKDRVFGALTCSKKLYQESIFPWGTNDYGIHHTPISEALSHIYTAAPINSGDLISSPELLFEIDYRKVDNPNVSNTISFSEIQGSLCHGFFLWFDTEITNGLGFSCGPDAGNKVYGSAFFPWKEPVNLEGVKKVTIDVSANLVADNYTWTWNSSIESKKGNVIEFKQSTFYAEQLAPNKLRINSIAKI